MKRLLDNLADTSHSNISGTVVASSFACILAIALAMTACLGLVGCFDDTSEFDFGTDDGTTSMTVLMYVVGSDLESDGGMATADIKEICKADLGDRVNVVLETGGAKKWHTAALKGKDLKRSVIQNGRLKVVDTLGSTDMTQPGTLADFIQWGTNAYPADRYALIMWDHGGGTQTGFGIDEVYGTESCMDLASIREGLESGGTHFDLMGFDACLMGTLETAATVAPYADYLVASEESEGATGWYYTNWLTKLGEVPNAPTLAVGSMIVDQFIHGPDASWWEDAELSVIDTSKIDAVYSQLGSYLKASGDYITSNSKGYKNLAAVRANTKSFGDAQFDQVDILSYATEAQESTGLEFDQLESAVKSAVAYEDSNMDSTTGLAMLYPYDWPSYYEAALESLKKAGVEQSDCEEYFGDFLTLTVLAQKKNGGTSSFIDGLLFEEVTTDSGSYSDYTKTSWFNKSLTGDYSAKDFQTLNDNNLKLKERNGYFYVKISSKEWATVKNVATGVYLVDGKSGWWDLGINDVYSYDESSGELSVDFDYNWITINNQFVSYYTIDHEASDDGSTWSSFGYSPAVLNGKTAIEVLVYSDQDSPNASVVGYRMASSSDEEEHAGYDRNSMQFEDGDKIEFTFDYYNAKGDFVDSEPLGKTVKYSSGRGLTVSTAELDSSYKTSVALRLTDIYNNTFWTEEVTIG